MQVSSCLLASQGMLGRVSVVLARQAEYRVLARAINVLVETGGCATIPRYTAIDSKTSLYRALLYSALFVYQVHYAERIHARHCPTTPA